MEGINLLPWRELQREDRKRQFIIMLISAILLGIFVIILSHTLIARKIQQQESVNNFLKTEIKDSNQNISEVNNLKHRKKSLIQRLELIYELQASRPSTVVIYDELVRVIPAELYITKLIRKGDTLTMEGYSESNKQISDLMKNVEHSKWFMAPQLQEIKTNHKQKNYRQSFILKLSLVPKNGLKAVIKSKVKQ